MNSKGTIVIVFIQEENKESSTLILLLQSIIFCKIGSVGPLGGDNCWFPLVIESSLSSTISAKSVMHHIRVKEAIQSQDTYYSLLNKVSL